MARRLPLACIAAAVSILIVAGCAKRERPIALYVLEELEAASAVKKPEDRISRLDIFIRNHADHPYRSLAYERVLEAMYGEVKDPAGAERYIARALARETDPSVRGDILFARFSRLNEADSTAAFAFAESLLAVERSPRLFLYIGYDLMGRAAVSGLAERCFVKAAELYESPAMRAQAYAMAGVNLAITGKKDEARKYLAMAEGNPSADMMMGGLLWASGDRERALDTYIRCAAVMPAVRARERLDSLYAMVHPGAKDLGDKIIALRIVDEGPLAAGRFVDLDGREYDLPKQGGGKTVIIALSPT